MNNAPDHTKLFEIYLDICNQALEANKERFPFKQILGAARRSEKHKNIEVCILGDRNPISYVIKITDKKITAKPHPFRKDCACERRWHVTRSYLEDVIKNAHQYIENPAKINWEWLQSTPDKGRP